MLDVRDLVVALPGVGPAVGPVSFGIGPGEILGVVGESGAGKSLTGAAIIGLLPPPARQASGAILLDGARIDTLPAAARARILGRRIGAIFQDPQATLDPLMTIGRHLTETMRAHLPISMAEARGRALRWLEEVGIPGGASRLDAYPHEFSGGQRQRIVIALALCAEPDLVIADEPTTALDVSVQAQIIALLKRLVRLHRTAVLLITHDMGVIGETADRVAVMYAGRIVEIGPVDAVVARPAHPYAAGLMAAIPPIHRRLDRLPQIDGTMPRPGALPAGCAFHPRCPAAFARCRAERPDLMAAGASLAACWLHRDG